MRFEPGDRVRWNTTGDDGLPWLRYGFVGRHDSGADCVHLMLDDQLSGDICAPTNELEPVTITNIELRLTGCDLLDDPSLRQGLVSLWAAEVDQAGIQIREMHLLGTGVLSATGFALAQLHSGGMGYVVNATAEAPTDTVWVRADPHLRQR